jgi:hypothetical protein
MRYGRSRAQLDIGDDSLGSQPPEKPATTRQAAQFDNRIAGVFRRMLSYFTDLLFLSLDLGRAILRWLILFLPSA